MSIGDSAKIIVHLTEEQKVGDMKKSDTLFFYLNVKNIVDKEGMRDIIEDEFLKQEAEETEARIKQIEVDQIIMKTWDDYNKGKLKGKLKRTKNGVKYLIIKEGEGEKAKERQRVKIGYYGMTHKEANAFDNSFRRDKDLEVIIGANQVILGWDEALREMKEGMKAVFFIPSKLAFGKTGKKPIIPPNADLVFYIELHEIIK
jgi:FKBP-type peptidyl-prolyl cis-trans isomerase